jgi:CMP-2-keto-3-deoxyoctulosonic acid synthetase
MMLKSNVVHVRLTEPERRALDAMAASYYLNRTTAADADAQAAEVRSSAGGVVLTNKDTPSGARRQAAPGGA